MAFEVLMFKPEIEYDLLINLSVHVQKNYRKLHGQHYYFHLDDLGDQKCQIDETTQFTDLYEFGDYLYIERDHQPCLTLRSDSNRIVLMINGRYVFAEHFVTKTGILVSRPAKSSLLPRPGEKVMTSVEMMYAFGMISDSLKKTKRDIA